MLGRVVSVHVGLGGDGWEIDFKSEWTEKEPRQLGGGEGGKMRGEKMGKSVICLWLFCYFKIKEVFMCLQARGHRERERDIEIQMTLKMEQKCRRRQEGLHSNQVECQHRAVVKSSNFLLSISRYFFIFHHSVQFSSVQLLSHVRLFATP